MVKETLSIQQVINPIKLETVITFYVCFEEQNILPMLTFCIKSKNKIILSLEICKSVLYDVLKNSLLKFMTYFQ